MLRRKNTLRKKARDEKPRDEKMREEKMREEYLRDEKKCLTKIGRTKIRPDTLSQGSDL